MASTLRQAAGNWQLLGGPAIEFAVARNLDGRLELIVLEHHLLAGYRRQTAANGAWGKWTGLGGGRRLRGLSVIANADGRLEAFATADDDSVWHAWQTTPGGSWSDWNSLSGKTLKGVELVSAPDGRIEAFVRGSDKAIWMRFQTAPSNGWCRDWLSLGGQFLSRPTAIANADGRIEVFAIAPDKTLCHSYEDVVRWSDWASLGGPSLRGDDTQPIAARNADGRLEVFYRGSDSQLWHGWQTKLGGDWSDWASLGGRLSYTSGIGPLIINNPDGRLEVFAKGENGSLWHIWQTAPGAAGRIGSLSIAQWVAPRSSAASIPTARSIFSSLITNITFGIVRDAGVDEAMRALSARCRPGRSGFPPVVMPA
jgi:acylphosphatase